MLDSGEVEESLRSMSVSSCRCGSYSGHCVKRDGSAKKKKSAYACAADAADAAAVWKFTEAVREGR